MGILKKAIKQALSDHGVQVEWLDTPSQVVQSAAQAKYHDTRKTEKGYIQGVHKARKEA